MLSLKLMFLCVWLNVVESMEISDFAGMAPARSFLRRLESRVCYHKCERSLPKHKLNMEKNILFFYKTYEKLVRK